ncbi:potassium transport system protein trkH1 [Halosimplex carlsbadense 2-9-1]|uniref:Potassium transport system protein trkH1 n=1 Tax=Halosimplex carlsbadense 2-9-1 TaxID=797114 RepID=M0CIK8_9EURY|nr:TrkH family potassium uptake protein [Halosimplex carlsbadense]ELZ23115.1 potassium transport system protein trkH1 [Halosimplex carlsbadense 2-9-1]
MRQRLQPLARDLGRILMALSGVMFASVVVSLAWGELFAVPALVVSGLVPLGLGRLLSTRYGDTGEVGKLHGMMIAASGWFLVAVFGTLPFVLVAWTVAVDPFPAPFAAPAALDTPTLAAFRDPLNGFFESMSGFTGTGLTMTDDEGALPRTVQWWRTIIEWVGGVGVIVLTTAILARPGSGSLTLYESEARSEKIHPSIVSTVRTIWWIFILFTFVSISLLWLAGMPIWDSINHGMTGLATGGFSVTDASIGEYNDPIIDFAMVPVMVLGSIAFPIHYLMLRGDLKNLYTDPQTRWLWGYFSLGSVALVGLLWIDGTFETGRVAVTNGVVLTGSTASLFQTIRYGLFQFVSAASCTGFGTTGIGDWSAPAQLTMSGAMVLGAAAGSTVGGIKLIRLITLVKGTAFSIRGVFYPESAVRYLKLDDRKLGESEVSRELEEASIIAFLWVLFLGVGLAVLLLTVDGSFTLENAIFEITSAQGNVGLSSGITGPAMPTPAKVMFLFNMWIGRLEIIPVLVLLRGLLDTFDFYR